MSMTVTAMQTPTPARDAQWRERLGLSGLTLVAGLGRTGLSCARFLHGLGLAVKVADSRREPPALAALRQTLPDVPVCLGALSEAALEGCAQLVLSPGIALDHPFVQAARRRGLAVLGDVELFARCVSAPVIAITGSNGKSTVTALLGEMAREAGRRVAVGGNIGTPVLDLLPDLHPDSYQAQPPDCYVLELSSYQLETTRSLAAAAATVLNLSPDHLDRHGDLATYGRLKARIHRGGGCVVWNRDEAFLAGILRATCLAGDRPAVSFGSDAPPGPADYGLCRRDGALWLMRGDTALIAATELALAGEHNLLNALAALALGEAAGLAQAPMLAVLRRFAGLPHRMERVASEDGVSWYNDSKATNVGATLAALRGLPGPVVLIAGGEGKGADFSPLRGAVAEKVRALVLLGHDAPRLARALGDLVPVQCVADMDEAVSVARRLACAGDQVLLSPACASLDMFAGYEARGDAFRTAVRRLAS